VPRFLPSLRRRGPVTSKAVQVRNEVKAVLADYYSSLWQYEAHRRARYWPVERAVVEGYERVIWCFKPVNQIGADHSKLPFKLTQNGQPVCTDNDHPLLHVLNVQANPLETGKVFRKRLSAQVLLSKAGAFVEMTKSNGGTIKRLDLLPPDRTELIPGSGQDLVSHVKLTRRDGTIREIPWEKVLWFRDPHPLDPYSGVTPLEAAGMSVELDYFARLYNVSFMQNDGRPGGVLGVRNPDGSTTDMDERLMDRVESRFGRGPVEAGKLSVLAGELSYVDLAAKPRDMQYGATSKNAKIEMLAAFGTPESVLGYSADRTFANAEQEHYNYWTVTMPGHNTIIVDGFGELTEDELTLDLDTSKIEVLQRAEIARREEARNEFTAGLRSIKSYADLAGYGDEIEDTVHTRSLYIPQGKTPLPSKAEDIEALGLGAPAPAAAVPGTTPPPQLEGAPGNGDAPTGRDVIGPAGAALAAAGDATTPQAPGPAPDAGGTAAAALAAATAGKSTRVTPTGRVLLRVDRVEEKRASSTVESELDEAARDRLENVITAALTALSTRWVKRTITRLESPKTRRGTRHWQVDPALPVDTRIGNKALDSAHIVYEQTWADEADEGTRPILTAAAALAAAGLLTDLAADDDHDDESVARIIAPVIAAVIALIRRAATVKAEQFTALINNADQRGDSITDIAAEVEEAGAKLTTWAEQVAVTVATGTLNGARDAAAEDIQAAGYADIERTWLSRRDDRVRESHRKADGQKQPVGSPFVVGNALLRFPCDPLGPIEEIAGCRCRLLHRSKRTGRFVAPPVQVAS
jgi:HK97 family phage portal protein